MKIEDKVKQEMEKYLRKQIEGMSYGQMEIYLSKMASLIEEIQSNKYDEYILGQDDGGAGIWRF